jgi:hypothetical protein
MPHSQHRIEATLRESIAAVLQVTGEQYKDLAVVTELAPPLVSRRQRGVISWRISDIGRLAEHWGMGADELFAGPARAVAGIPKKRVRQLRESKSRPFSGAA